MSENYFNELNNINVNDKTEKKNGLTYLSWAYAWGELKKKHPEANYTIYETPTGCNYFTDGRTAWVKVGVTVNGLEHIEYLPIMDFKNKAITLDYVTSIEVNKAIQRALTKAIARHGLGLYIYAGEDLPKQDGGAAATTPRTSAPRQAAPARTTAPKQAQGQQAQAPDYREELRRYMKENGIDNEFVVITCGLGPTSTNEEYRQALEYCKTVKAAS